MPAEPTQQTAGAAAGQQSPTLDPTPAPPFPTASANASSCSPAPVGGAGRLEVMIAVAAAAIRPSTRSVSLAGQARAILPSLCPVLTRSHDSRTLTQRGRLLGTYLKHIICNAIDRGASETQRSHAMRASFCAAPIHLYAAVARIPKTVSLPSESS